MRKHQNVALLLIAWFTFLGFELPTASATWVTTFDTGVQLDYLRWNISDSDSNPNILSELTFKTISPMGRLNVRWYSQDNPWWLSGEYGFGKIVDGSVKDEDFAENNRQGTFSQSTHDANDHNIQTGNIRIGYQVLNGTQTHFSPTLGFQWQYSRIKIQDGRRKVPDNNVDYSRLNSTYSAQWLSMALGGMLEYRATSIPFLFSVDANFFPFASYEGVGRWNLRSDFAQSPSFEHSAKGWGASLEVETQWLPRDHWRIGVGARGQYFKANNGTDKTHFSDGTNGTVPLRQVIHKTSFFFFNISYEY